jgi:hypothetical protein
MDFYLKLAYAPQVGLCNQLYSLAGCIDYCIFTGKYKTINISNFCVDINDGGFVCISDILDMDHLNKWGSNYNLIFKDGDKIEGNYIPSPIIFFGGSKNKNIFIDVLKKGIKFNTIIKDCIDIPKLSENNITIIHMRLEPDVVNHYKNEMNLSDMQMKYIDLINIYCNPQHDFLVILTGNDEGNNDLVYNYLTSVGYKYYISKKKYFSKREINAISDMIIATELMSSGKVNKILGVYESSFSYTLIHQCFASANECCAGVCSFLNSAFKHITTETPANEYQKFIL